MPYILNPSRTEIHFSWPVIARFHGDGIVTTNGFRVLDAVGAVVLTVPGRGYSMSDFASNGDLLMKLAEDVVALDGALVEAATSSAGSTTDLVTVGFPAYDVAMVEGDRVHAQFAFIRHQTDGLSEFSVEVDDTMGLLRPANWTWSFLGGVTPGYKAARQWVSREGAAGLPVPPPAPVSPTVPANSADVLSVVQALTTSMATALTSLNEARAELALAREAILELDARNLTLAGATIAAVDRLAQARAEQEAIAPPVAEAAPPAPVPSPNGPSFGTLLVAAGLANIVTR